MLATDVDWGEEGGSIFPGGVGFDINCGVRMVALDCSVDDIPNIDRLAGRLNGRIPSGGSGKGGLEIQITIYKKLSQGEQMQWLTLVLLMMKT